MRASLLDSDVILIEPIVEGDLLELVEVDSGRAADEHLDLLGAEHDEGVGGAHAVEAVVEGPELLVDGIVQQEIYV